VSAPRAAALAFGLAWACAAPPDEPREPVPVPSVTPAASSLVPSVDAAQEVSKSVPPEPNVDLSKLWSLDRDPTFQPVTAALEQGKLESALAAMDRLVASETTAPSERRTRTSYVHATLLERAGKPSVAVAKYLEVSQSKHPLADAARLRGARLQATLGKDADAVALATSVSSDAFDERDVLAATAVSLARTAAIARVRVACESLYLPSGARRPGWSTEGLRVLTSLAQRREPEALTLSLELGDALILDGPRGRVAGDAEKIVRSLEGRLSFPEQKARRAEEPARRIERAARLAASGQEKKAVAILDRLKKPVEKLASTDPTVCRYHLARGRALGLVKRKGEAWQAFEEAGRACSAPSAADEIERARGGERGDGNNEQHPSPHSAAPPRVSTRPSRRRTRGTSSRTTRVSKRRAPFRSAVPKRPLRPSWRTSRSAIPRAIGRATPCSNAFSSRSPATTARHFARPLQRSRS
jgi:hypothetical protein